MTTDTKIHSPKKLIEVTLPLDEINAACVREKSIRHGHPSTLHLWWARRPLAAARAVIFASMVNDPGYVNKDYRHGVNKEEAQRRREELCDLIKELVKWENLNNTDLLSRANQLMQESWRELCSYNKNHPRAKELFDPNNLPAFHDLFAGGGALPLEAQRLGIHSFASDLNPVSVLINKGLIDIPCRFRNNQPCGPLVQGENAEINHEWSGNNGLSEDIRRYGNWMLENAIKKIGKNYPEVEITKEIANKRPDLTSLVGKKFPVIAWIWARTVKSPNPLYADCDVPLAASFVLSKKTNHEAYVRPIVSGKNYSFEVCLGKCPPELVSGTSAGKMAAFTCLVSGSPISYDHIRTQALTKGLGSRLMAIVISAGKNRLFIPADSTQEQAAQVTPPWHPFGRLPEKALGFRVQNYGMTEWADLFSSRQTLALTTFSDLISGQEDQTVVQKATQDAIKAGKINDNIPLAEGGCGARAYGEAIGLYMSFIVDKCADYWSTICTWHNSGLKIGHTFGRQAIPMAWDYCEANPFSSASGCWKNMVDWVSDAIKNLPLSGNGEALQLAAQTQALSKNKVISTDPPYYDNVGYANLSDYFYVWLRKNLSNIYPDICATFSTPKQEELIADTNRCGSKEAAEQYFLSGMTDVMHLLCTKAHPAFPVTIYYAFKQSETKEGTTTNKGWVTFLEAVVKAGFQITGTWPLRTELQNRTRGIGSNALASSIVLVCRRRPDEAESISKKQFQRELKDRLSVALEEMTSGSNHSAIAPVDLSQAIIGPGMEVFSRYKEILDASGNNLTVGEALKMINNFLDEDAFDADTQFGLTWFKTHQWNEGDFGTADNLARAKGRSVADLASSGILTASKGVVQLIHWQKLPSDWDPEIDTQVSTWEACHHLIRALQLGGGIHAAASLLAKLTSISSDIQLFCSTMYTLCEREKWTEDSKAYNELSTSWPQIEEIAEELRQATPRQASLF